MDLTWTSQEQAFRAECREWLEANVPNPPLPSGDTAEGFALHLEWERKLFADRWAVVSWPVEHGGRGASLWEWLIFEEEYYRVGAPQRVTQNGIFLLAPTIFEFGTPAQKEEWLEPLLDAEIRSAFCMTEPDVASSDASQIATRIVRDGDEYVITGRKWWSTGAMNPDCALLVVMGATDPEAERHRRQSMVLVPRDTPGVRIVRPLTVFGYDDRDHGGHAEITFTDVRVPATNLIGGEGDGFAIAQARLGPGRIHHCMRAIGMAEHALALVRERAATRVAFGRPLAEQGVVREWVAESRIQIESLRLLVLKTAWLMDTVGNREAMTEIQAIKIAVPRAVQQILDRAIQVFGGAGVSDDTPLAEMFAGSRVLRLADGPDEVHLSALGKAEFRR